MSNFFENPISDKILNVANEAFYALTEKKVSTTEDDFEESCGAISTQFKNKNLEDYEEKINIKNDSSVTIGVRDWGWWFCENDDEYESLSDDSKDKLNDIVEAINSTHKDFNATYSYGNEWVFIDIELKK